MLLERVPWFSFYTKLDFLLLGLVKARTFEIGCWGDACQIADL